LASRGCSEVIAIEQNIQCLKFIKKTADDFGMTTVKVIRYDAFRFIKSTPKKFDFIFADPPYALTNIAEISELVISNKLLNENGWLVVEHPKEVDLTSQEYFFEQRKYGQVNFSFFNFAKTE
jgi:16S rRNA G966 N2-methylase RsmD